MEWGPTPESIAKLDSTRPRRTQIDIIVSILEVSSGGATKTALVYKSNLNFTIAQKYITLLRRSRLLEALETSRGSTRYKTTRRGSEALEALRSARSLVFEEAIQ